ncbi:hypothetical protein ACQEU3_46115 [Spirillospora sp. CA-253888]
MRYLERRPEHPHGLCGSAAELIPDPNEVLVWAEQVMAQLDPGRPYALRLEPDGLYTGYHVWLDLGGSASGSLFALPEPPEQALARLADQLQEHVLETTHGRPVPVCPGHRHPAVADVVNGTAVWRCMDSPALVVRPIL